MAYASEEASLVAGPSDPQGSEGAADAGKAGSALGPLHDILANLIHRRHEKWDRLLSVAFVEIQSKLGKSESEKIVSSDGFLTFVIEATRIACRNHDDEKLGALRNAVVRSALPGGPDEPLRLMFLRLIDYFTPLHLVAVAVLNDPAVYMERHSIPNPHWPLGTAARLIDYCVSAFDGRLALIEMVVRDLQGAGLAEQGYFLRMPTSEAAMMQPRTTDTGRLFVDFISSV